MAESSAPIGSCQLVSVEGEIEVEVRIVSARKNGSSTLHLTAVDILNSCGLELTEDSDDLNNSPRTSGYSSVETTTPRTSSGASSDSCIPHSGDGVGLGTITSLRYGNFDLDNHLLKDARNNQLQSSHTRDEISSDKTRGWNSTYCSLRQRRIYLDYIRLKHKTDFLHLKDQKLIKRQEELCERARELMLKSPPQLKRVHLKNIRNTSISEPVVAAKYSHIYKENDDELNNDKSLYFNRNSRLRKAVRRKRSQNEHYSYPIDFHNSPVFL